MPAGAGKSDCRDLTFPENPVSRQAESVAFGNGIVWPGDRQCCQSAVLTACVTPSGGSLTRRGDLCLLIRCGAPVRGCRAPSCLREWRIRCCHFHVLRQDAAEAWAALS